MSIKEAFEDWYKREYWDFSYRGAAHVAYDETKDCYNHLDVTLAYNAFKAGYELCTQKNFLSGRTSGGSPLYAIQ